jgi:predicted nuclease with RNAse H fold
VITAGVDLASQAVRTAACEVNWSGGHAEVTVLTASGVDDEAILGLVERAGKTGLDVPLGWPQPFVDAVSAHHSRRPWTGGTQYQLRFRATDHHVAAETGRWPLSVSSDLIALPALRAAALMARVHEEVDRSGAGRFVEVYPASALRRWGFIGHGYKNRAGAENRSVLVPLFRRRTERWLRMTEDRWHMCELSDDAFDAVLAALVARAAHIGWCDPMPDALRDVGSREGWIALPFTDSLARLAQP